MTRNIVFSLIILRLICLTFLPALLLTEVAAETLNSSPPQTVAAKVGKACGVKNIDERLAALVELGKTLSMSEIAEALKTTEHLQQLRERVVLTETVLTRWGELSPAEAFAHISSMPEGATKVNALRGVIPVYAKKDVITLSAAALKMTPGRARTEAVQLVAEAWAKQDVKAALKWVDGLPDGVPREGALHHIYFVWVHLDPAGISNTVQNLAPGNTRNALIINVAGDWAAKDAPGAVKWAEALPIEADKQTALATVAESWADVQPLAALEFALKLSPYELSQRAVPAAVARWATQDPERALSWVTTNIHDFALQQQCVTQVLTVQVPVSPEAAAQCVEQLLSGPAGDGAIQTYVENVRFWNPAAGVRIAMKSADALIREGRVRDCFRTWLAWDPAAAKQWLQGTDFPEATKHRWLTEKEPPEF